MPDTDEQEDDFLDHLPIKCPEDDSFAAFLAEPMPEGGE